MGRTFTMRSLRSVVVPVTELNAESLKGVVTVSVAPSPKVEAQVAYAVDTSVAKASKREAECILK